MFKCIPFACKSQIEYLDKRHCNLENVPDDVMRYSRSLEELLLDSNHLKDLSKPLFKLARLRRLQLSDNEIEKIPSEISAFQSLVELDLSKNNFDELPESINSCKCLQYLDISSNPIVKFPDHLMQLQTLKHLGLSDISLTRLPDALGNLVNLTSLEVRENLLSSLPTSISYLARLELLDMGNNELNKLPPEIGKLTSLKELYVDGNDLVTLPKEIGELRSLQSIDVSENKIESLPEEIGELRSLTDFTLSQNCLELLPHTIGRLKNLQILKLDQNRLITLTPAVGTCTKLNELILTENLLTELPSSLGNLKEMCILNVDKNRLKELPSTLGSCEKLGVLSFRENEVAELPLELGKLALLHVLDVSGNRLQHLPFTLTALNLHALWLSENQSQPLLKLQTDEDPRTGIKVLTCYLLPQQGCNAAPQESFGQMQERRSNSGFVGGPTVHFTDMESPSADEEASGKPLQRHDTPHPKTMPQKLKNIDGHVIQHEQGHHPKGLDVIQLKRTGSIERKQSPPPATAAAQPKRSAPPVPPPRMSLQHHQQQQPQAHAQEPVAKEEPPPVVRNREPVTSYQPKSVLFDDVADDDDDNEDKMESKLRRRDTPHYLKGKRLTPLDADEARERVVEILGQDTGRPAIVADDDDTQEDFEYSPLGHQSPLNGYPSSKMEFTTEIERSTVTLDKVVGNMGLSIAGGVESTPFKGDDEGIFISRIMEGGAAYKVGLKIGDKVLNVNGKSMIGIRHNDAVKMMKDAGDRLILTIEREVRKPTAGAPKFQSPNTSFSSDYLGETVITTIKRDTINGPGFTIAGGRGSSPYRAGDDINGTNMLNARHDQAVAMLTDGNEVHLVVQRDRSAPLMSPLNLEPLSTDFDRSTTLDTSFGPLAQSSPVQRDSATRTPSITGPAPLAGYESPFGSPRLVNGHSFESPYSIEEVTLEKVKGSLGISIAGGSDHASHPFGIYEPGVFISRITPNGPAARSGAFRIGDRILKVGNVDVSKKTHNDVVTELKNASDKLTMTVRHDPQPPGLREIIVTKRPDEMLGMNVIGGSKNYVNPNDKTDEGVFIGNVKEGGAVAKNGRVKAGMRILEVNNYSLLGVTLDEALERLRAVGTEVRLLVCDGFDPRLIPPEVRATFDRDASQQSIHVEGAGYITADALSNASTMSIISSSMRLTDEKRFNGGDRNAVQPSGGGMSTSQPPPPPPLQSKIPVRSPLLGAGATPDGAPSSPQSPTKTTFGTSAIPKPFSSAPAAAAAPKPVADATAAVSTSVPAPPAPPAAAKPGPPPVAPKPSRIPPPASLNVDDMDENLDPIKESKIPSARPTTSPTPAGPSPATPSSNPEKLTFSSKLKRFEQVTQKESRIPTAASSKKFTYLSEHEVQRLKEEESRKIASSLGGDPPERILGDGFNDEDEAARSYENMSFGAGAGGGASGGGGQHVRTKKAENRFGGGGGANAGDPELSPTAQRALEAEKRAKWRQDRMKSLEAEALFAEKIMEQVRKLDSTENLTGHETVSRQLPEGINFEPEITTKPLIETNGNAKCFGGEIEREVIEDVDPVTGQKRRKVIERRHIISQHESSTTERRVHKMEIPRGSSRLNQQIDFIDESATHKQK